MDLGLKGRKAIVSAASRGLGLAAARSLAREGVALTMNARSAEALEKAAADAIETPVTAPKIEFPITVAKVNLAGIFFRDLFIKTYKSFAAPDLEINSPIKTNRGITANI